MAAKQSLPSSIQRKPPEGWSRVDGDATGRPQDGTQILALPGSQYPCPLVQMSFIYRGIRPRPHAGTLTEHHKFILCGSRGHLKTKGRKLRRGHFGLSRKKDVKLLEILSLPLFSSPFQSFSVPTPFLQPVCHGCLTLAQGQRHRGTETSCSSTPIGRASLCFPHPSLPHLLPPEPLCLPPLQILLPQPGPLRPTLSMKSFPTAPDCSSHYSPLDTRSIYFTRCTFCLSVHSPGRCPISSRSVGLQA